MMWPNPECQYYGTGFRELNAPSIWEIKGTIDTLEVK